MVLSNLVAVFEQTGDLEHAEKTALETLEKARTALGPDDSLVIANLDNLANVDLRQKRYDEAERLYREAYETRRRTLPPET